MAHSSDIDITLDGFDPDDALRPARSRSGRRRASQFDGPIVASHSQPEIVDEPSAPTPQPAPEPAPAPEPKPKPKAPKAKGESPLAFLHSEGLRLFLAGFLFLLSVMVVVGFVSYLKSGALDQSEALNRTASEIAADAPKVQNWGGAVGLWLSHTLMARGFGLGSFALVVYFIALALALIGKAKVSFWSATFKCLLVMITTSVVLGLCFYSSPSFFYLGGEHGHYINELIIRYATPFGAILVSLLLLLAVASVYIADLRRAYSFVKKKADAARLQHELALQQSRELEDLTAAGVDDAANEPAADESAADSNDSSEEAPADAPAADPEGTEPEAPAVEDEGPAPLPVLDPNASADDDVENSTFTITQPQIELASDDQPDPSHVGVDEPFDHRAELSSYVFPPVDLLEERPQRQNVDVAEQQENKDRIVNTLAEYKIGVSKIEATVGPTVTLYEIVPAEGVRIAQIKRLEDDIALSLAALGIRIIAPIPGKGTVGIEVPNREAQTVSMRSVMASKKFKECNMALPMAMGATISNDIFIADLAKMPHLLVAGATGMGKSVGLNAIIASLLYKKHPSELKFVLIDPKMVEFSLYSKLERHYLAKLPDEEDAIITDMAKVIQTLNSLCVEMDDRYALLRKAGVRSLEEYNRKFAQRRLNPENGHKYLPYIVVIVDEFADLIMTAGKEVETPIARIAQKARAVGIHMIIATQRPSTNVITGLIKANFPARVAFRVSQMVDSRTILDQPGANRLIGRGDMLFSHNGSLERVQCAFISTEEVEALTEYIDNQVGYATAYALPEYVPETEGGGGGAAAGGSMERDALFDEAARFVVSRQQGSTSSLQRQFGIGYNRAGKLMDQMEAAGIVGPVNGSKPRPILVDIIALDAILTPQQ